MTTPEPAGMYAVVRVWTARGWSLTYVSDGTYWIVVNDGSTTMAVTT